MVKLGASKYKSKLGASIAEVHAAAVELEQSSIRIEILDKDISFNLDDWPSNVYNFARHIKELSSEAYTELQTNNILKVLPKIENLIEQGFAESINVRKDPFDEIYFTSPKLWKEHIVDGFNRDLLRCKNNEDIENVLSTIDAGKELYNFDLEALYKQLQTVLRKLSTDLYKNYRTLVERGNLLNSIVIPPVKRSGLKFRIPSSKANNGEDENNTSIQGDVENKINSYFKGNLTKEDLKRAVNPYINHAGMLSEYNAIGIDFALFGVMINPQKSISELIKRTDGNLVGLDKVKADLENHITKFLDKEALSKHAYLYGAPGTGKTTLVYSLANEHPKLKIVTASPMLIPVAIDFAKANREYSFWLLYDDWRISEHEVIEWTAILDGKYVYPKNLEIVITSNQEKVHDKIARRIGQHYKIDLPKREDIGEIIDLISNKYGVNIGNIKDSLIEKFKKVSGAEIERVFKLAKDRDAVGDAVLELANEAEKHMPETRPEMYR